MSDAPTPKLSASWCVKRSAAQCKQLWTTPSASTFGILAAKLPIWGFGTFIGANNSYSGLIPAPSTSIPPDPCQIFGCGMAQCQDSWPNVYTTLTETIEDLVTSTTDTLVTVLTGYPDSPVAYSVNGGPLTHTNSGPSGWTNPPISSIGSYSAGPGNTSCSLLYTNASTGHACKYTAAVSVPFGTSATWSTLAASCHNFLSGQTIPTPTGGGNVTVVEQYYNSGSPALNVSTRATSRIVLACAYGLPMRWGPNANLFTTGGICGDIVDGLSIVDEATYNSQLSGGYYYIQNIGTIVCLESQWDLTGAAPGSGDPNTNNHLALWGQQVIATGTFPGESVTLASATEYLAGVTANSISYSNPIPAGITATFLDTDAPGNTGYTFGLLGFWSTLN